MGKQNKFLTLNNQAFHIREFARKASSSVDANALVLDAGAGDSPYREFFRNCEYEATDVCLRPHHDYKHVNYICNLSEIPVPDNRFDMILCTQVLEHVPNPQQVLCELHRVLKPAGKVWLSTPLYFDEHEIPYDFFRYTQYGLRSLFEKAGFEVESVDWLGGYFGTVAYQLQLAWHYLPTRPKDCGGGMVGLAIAALMWCVRPLLAVIGLIFAKLDLYHQYNRKGHCIDYGVVAVKR